jgi:hypothetical protein
MTVKELFVGNIEKKRVVLAAKAPRLNLLLSCPDYISISDNAGRLQFWWSMNGGRDFGWSR